MFSRFARPIDLRQIRTPRPLGAGIGSIGFPDNGIGFPDNGLGDVTYGPDVFQVTPNQTPSTISTNLSSQLQPGQPTQQTQGMNSQDWAQIIGASTAGLMNVIGSAFNVAAFQQASTAARRGYVQPTQPAAGIGLGVMALLVGGGFVVYLLVRRKRS